MDDDKIIDIGFECGIICRDSNNGRHYVNGNYDRECISVEELIEFVREIIRSEKND